MKTDLSLSGLVFWTCAVAGCAWIATISPKQCPAFEWHRSFAMGVTPPVRHIITLNGERELRWDGQPISWQQLFGNLQSADAGIFQPVIIFRPERNAECADKMRVRIAMNRLSHCFSSGACGEGHQWDDGAASPLRREGTRSTPR